jgi:hypothetical protein
MIRCPICSQHDVRAVERPWSAVQRFFSLFGYRPYRCQLCGHLFRSKAVIVRREPPVADPEPDRNGVADLFLPPEDGRSASEILDEIRRAEEKATLKNP